MTKNFPYQTSLALQDFNFVRTMSPPSPRPEVSVCHESNHRRGAGGGGGANHPQWGQWDGCRIKPVVRRGHVGRARQNSIHPHHLGISNIHKGPIGCFCHWAGLIGISQERVMVPGIVLL